MTTDLEQAARAEAERRWPKPDPQTGADRPPADGARIQGFEAGASWLASHLLSDESVEKAARVIYDDDPVSKIVSWDEVDRQGWLDCARAALSAVLGKETP